MDFSCLAPITAVEPLEIQKVDGSPEKQQLKMEKACQSFESMFASTLLSQMVNSIGLHTESGTSQMQEKWTWTMMAQSIAQNMTENGSLGLTAILQQEVQDRGK